MKSITDIKRDIANDISQRTARENPDTKDFLLRKYLLNFDKSQPEAAKVYQATLQEILVQCYPEFFVIIDEQFKINPELDNAKRNDILSAFGQPIPKAGKEVGPFTISYEQFDFKQLELLFATDKNPLWLILEQNIALNTKSKSVPIGQTTSNLLSDTRIVFTAKDKVKNYIELAKVFKAGRSTQVAQSIQRVSMSVFSSVKTVLKKGDIDLPDHNTDNVAKIKTPGPDKAMQEVLSMTQKAIDIAIEHPECRELIDQAFRPLKDWTVAETIQDTVLPRALVTGIQAAVMPKLPINAMEERPDNLGDWVIKNAPICCPPGNEVKCNFYTMLRKLPENTNNKQYAQSTSHTENSPITSRNNGRYDKQIAILTTIINTHKSAKPTSTQGQKYEVAVAVKNYLEGTEAYWFTVCQLKKSNPDWDSPDGITGLFSKSPLFQCIEYIEKEDNNAKAAAKFHKALPLLNTYLSKEEVNNLTVQMCGKAKYSPLKLIAIKAKLSNPSQSELSKLVEEISLSLTNISPDKKKSRQDEIKRVSEQMGRK